MAKKNIFGDYTPTTQNFLKSTLNYLKHKYGTVNDEWMPTLVILADNYELYNQCKTQIAKDGLMIQDRFGSLAKHPLLKVQNDSQIQIIKLLNEFGLTPKAASKLNVEEMEEESELTKFLND